MSDTLPRKDVPIPLHESYEILVCPYCGDKLDEGGDYGGLCNHWRDRQEMYVRGVRITVYPIKETG